MKLNLGCGDKTVPGHVGVDRARCAAADLRADIARRLPFGDQAFDAVLLDNVIEHIDDIPALMRELWRVTCPGGSVRVITPHFASAASWVDPTHRHHLSWFSLDYFTAGSGTHYTAAGFRMRARRLSFGGLSGNIGRLLFRLSPRRYEARWCFIFRPSTLVFELERLPDSESG